MDDRLAHRTRLAALLLALVLVLAACTGGGSDDGEQPDDESAAEDRDEEDRDEDDEDLDDEDEDAGGLRIPVAAGATLPDVNPELLQAAQRWIHEESGLSEMLQEELYLESASTTQEVTHLTYVQEHDRVAVQGAVFIVHITADAEVLGASQSLTTVLPGEDGQMLLDEQAAITAAAKAVDGTIDGDPVVGATWLEVGKELRLGWSVQLATTNPTSNYEVIVDGTNGEVLSVRETIIHHGHGDASDLEVTQADALCAVPAPPSACIYVVHPLFAGGADAVASNPNIALTGVPLTNLLDPTDGQLIGTYAQIWQPEAATYTDPDNVYGELGRGGQDTTFEAAMTYYWIDYAQQVVQSLGYRYHSDDPVDFVPIDPEFRDNAAYLPFFDRIHMGDSFSGINFAEDGDVVAHEYGHAMLEAAVRNISSAEGAAFHEAFGDLTALFTTLEFRTGDVACLGAWSAEGSCIRRLDTDLVHPADLRFEPHLDAQIFTGAVWDVLEARLAQDGLRPEDCQTRPTPCDTARDEVFGTVLGALPFLTPQLSMQDAADAFAAADATFYGGQNADIISTAFAAHGLLIGGGDQVIISQPGGGTADPMEDVGEAAGGTQVSLTVDHTFRGDLQITLGVTDAEGEVICTPIPLLSPDESDGQDNVTGVADVSDSDCAALAPPAEDRVWLISVVDTVAQDTGEVRSFSVIHEGVEHRAGGLPVTIPDDDPLGVIVFVGGDSSPPADTMTPSGAGDTPGAPAPAPPAAGSVTAELSIQHTYSGDLSIAMGVIDPATDDVLCAITVLEADSSNASPDVELSIDASECAPHYPPGPGRTWVLRVLDNAPVDTGTIQSFTLTGPDGVTRSLEAPLAIPDDDESGTFVVFSS